MSLELAAHKAGLRLEMKARRAQLDESARARASWLVCAVLGDWLQTRPESRVAIFLARPFEINLDALARELISAEKIVCAPRVHIETNSMTFQRLRDLDEVTRGPWGVREPTSSELVAPELALVPGLAFDHSGRRLGTGGGWYDRVLGAIPVKVGATFGGQIVEEVPVEAHDIKMDWVASEEGIVKCE